MPETHVIRRMTGRMHDLERQIAGTRLAAHRQSVATARRIRRPARATDTSGSRPLAIVQRATVPHSRGRHAGAAAQGVVETHLHRDPVHPGTGRHDVFTVEREDGFGGVWFVQFSNHDFSPGELDKINKIFKIDKISF